MTDSPTSSTANTGDSHHIVIDAEHFSVRFLVPVLTLGFTLVAHLVGLRILEMILDDSVNLLCIMLPLDLVIFFVAGYVIEAGLKRLIPSQRYARLTDTALVVVDNRGSQRREWHIEWTSTVNVQAWRFRVRRRSRIPKGWLCLAVQLLQDEQDVILYTFMAPEAAEKLRSYDQFTRLRPRKETESNSDLSAVAAQRRLLKLEDRRWEDGGEIKAHDFQLLLHRLEQSVDDWMPV